MTPTVRLFPVLVILCGSLAAALTPAQQAEQKATQVSLEIYQASVKQWNSELNTKFNEAVTEAANSYCNGTNKCCLGQDWSGTPPFGNAQVDVTNVEYQKPYLTLDFALTFPNPHATAAHTACGNELFVPKSDVTGVLNQAAPEFGKASGKYIVSMDDGTAKTRLTLPPDSTLNWALCVTAVALLLIMVATCQILNRKCGTPPEELKRPANGEIMKSSAKSKESIPSNTSPGVIELVSVENIHDNIRDKNYNAKHEAVLV